MSRIIKSLFKLFLALIFTCTVSMPLTASAELKPFRAVWVSSVYGIDYPKEPTTDENSLKMQADSILDGAKEMGMTAVILQVRPASDALYSSTVFPWSKYLTGTQGLAPSNEFDPLTYWVNGAHARGMELHAWINPFRVANSDTDFAQMAENHPAKQNPHWVIRHSNGKYYFNPGIYEVRSLIRKGAEEIVNGYDVDGLHLDDYFYPGTDFDDADAFAKYGEGFDDIGAWRRNNINLLISDLHEMVESSEKDIDFGVSPAGIWANEKNMPDGSQTSGKESYFSAYADSRRWVTEGWVDYICPQLYWYIGHSAADYKTLVNWWADAVRGSGVKLYIGIADYQAGNVDSSSPWHGIAAIRQALELNSTISEIEGEVHFSYQSIAEYKTLKRFYEAIYNGKEFSENSMRFCKICETIFVSARKIITLIA